MKSKRKQLKFATFTYEGKIEICFKITLFSQCKFQT